MATENLKFIVSSNKKYGEHGAFFYDGIAQLEFERELAKAGVNVIQLLASRTELDNDGSPFDEILLLCSRYTKKYPEFITAYVIAGIALNANNEVKGSNIWLKRAVDLAIPLIPSDFNGQIPAEIGYNDIFLIAHFSYIGTIVPDALDNNARTSFVNEIEKHYSWTKDNFLVKQVLVDCHSTFGDHNRAIDLMSGHDFYLPFIYSRALIHFKANELTEAITLLRKAIAINPYVPELLFGTEAAMDKPFVIYQDDKLYAQADSIVDSMVGRSWQESDGYRKIYNLDFLNWVYNCPQSLRDRADLIELSDAVELGDHTEESLEKFNQEINDYLDKITNESSKSCVTMRKLGSGEKIYKWVYTPDVDDED